MNRAVARRAAIALPALALVLAVVAAGCSIHEQTQIWYAPADGVNADAGPIGLRNVLVVADGDDATVLAGLANTGDEADDLVAVTVGDVEASPAAPVEIPGGGYASLGFTDGAVRVDVAGSGATPGHMVTLEFRFASAPRAEVDVFVEPATQAYADAFEGFVPLEAADESE